MDDERVLRLLASIDRRLALLTGPQERNLREALVTDVLRTSARTKMFDAINGSRGSPELARIAGVGERAAQLFVKELLELGLVRPVDTDTSRGVIVERHEDAIVQWYVRRQAA